MMREAELRTILTAVSTLAKLALNGETSAMDYDPTQKRDEYGKWTREINIKIDPTRDNILPELNKEDADALGVDNKPVLLKKSIIERNKEKHADIPDEMANEILTKALYGRDKIIPSTWPSKPDYHHFAKFVDGHNYLVLVDFAPSKTHNEVVHYHVMRDKDFLKLIQKAIKMEKKIIEK